MCNILNLCKNNKNVSNKIKFIYALSYLNYAFFILHIKLQRTCALWLFCFYKNHKPTPFIHDICMMYLYNKLTK